MYKTHFYNNNMQQFVDEVLQSSVSDILGQNITIKSPNANIKESSSQFIIEIVAPGLVKSDFSLTILDDKLHVSVDKPEVILSEDSKYVKNEWAFNKWKRSFSLGDKINRDQISAKYEEGILIISLSKKEKESNQEITQINIQ